MRLEEFEVLEKAATPGPWETETLKSHNRSCLGEKYAALAIGERYVHDQLTGNDARFIAAAREMVPRMIKALKAVKEELLADYDSEEMWPISSKAIAELEQP
jgi:hypothetical protein